MSLRICLILLCALPALHALLYKGDIFSVRRAATGAATLSTMSVDTGKVNLTSPIAFDYPSPLAQATYDSHRRRYLLITYVDKGDNATLFAIDRDTLKQVDLWSTAKDSYFDLQYSKNQDAVFGIAVEGTYGRWLSQFTLGKPDVTFQHLVQLPLYWYVNASSFDHATNRYFGLLNNFTGTYNQKLAVGDFTSPQTAKYTKFLDLDPRMTIHYIAWADVGQCLYGLATRPSPARNAPEIVVIDTTTGIYSSVGLFSPGEEYTSGPMVVDDNGLIYFYARVSTGALVGQWELYEAWAGPGFKYQVRVARYDPGLEFAVAVWAQF